MSEKPLILIIDDEQDMCWALENILMLSGFSARTATRGEEGLGLIRQLNPNIRLIFLDAKLPDIDGLKLAGIIREQYPEIKIVIITGYYYRDTELVQECLASGQFDGFIGKPFNISEIRAAMEKALTT